MTLWLIAGFLLIIGLVSGFSAVKSQFSRSDAVVPAILLLVLAPLSGFMLYSGPEVIQYVGLYLLLCVGQLIGLLVRGLKLIER